MTDSSDPAPETSPILRDGVRAGFAAALAVAAIHLVSDWLGGSALRTPSSLYALLLLDTQPPIPARADWALAFTTLHFLAWILLGVSGSLVVTVSDVYPRLWTAATAVSSVLAVSILYLSVVAPLPGLHVWLGTLVGGGVLLALLLIRRPGVVKHPLRAAVTELTETCLQEALADERRARDRYRAILDALGPDPVFDGVVRSREEHVERLVRLFDRYDLEPGPTPPADGEPIPASLAAAHREAADAEYARIDRYDRALALVDEPTIRGVLLALRAATADEILPRFERSLRGSGTSGGV